MISERPWRIEVVLLMASAILMSMIAGSLVVIMLDHLLGKQNVSSLSFYSFMVATISFQGVGLLLIHLFIRLHGLGWKEFLLPVSRNLKWVLAWSAGMACVAIPATLGLNQLSAYLITRFHGDPKEQAAMQVFHSAGGWERVAFGFTAIILAPIVEEILFRGILYPLLKQKGSRMLALWGSSLLFAASHQNLLTFVPLVFLAMLLVYSYEKTDSLLAPITMHSLFNAVNFVLLFILPPQ